MKLLLINLAVIVGLFFGFFYQRNDTILEARLIEFAQEHCQFDEWCEVDLNDLTNFNWDKAYFLGNDTPDTIRETISVPYHLYQDIGDKIIFIKGNDIVYYQEFFPPAERPERPYLYLPFRGIGINYSYILLTRHNSKLLLKISRPDGPYQSILVKPYSAKQTYNIVRQQQND